MAAYYVASDGSNTSPYDTWAKAATTFAVAVTAATGNGDVIYVDQGFTDTLSTSTIYTFANHVSVICSNDKTNAPPQTLGTMGDSNWIGHSSTTYRITLTGAYKVYFYGMTFRVGGSGSDFILASWGDGSHFEFENCLFWLSTSSTSAYIVFNSTSINNAYSRLKNCLFRFNHTEQKLFISQCADLEGCSIHASSLIPMAFFAPGDSSATPGFVNLNGCDFSLLSGFLVGSHNNGASQYVFANCKLHGSTTALATQTPANKGSAKVWLYNCASGDQHYNIAHYDAFGSTIVDTGIYANDGAQYDGTNRCSWKITTTANCSYYTPYVSPWIDCYHSGTSAITPYLEILRDGDATAYKDNEVWLELSYQGTLGVPLAIIITDRRGLLLADAEQDAGVGSSGWAGSVTSWSGKLSPTDSITPVESGHLRARICVGRPSITVYVDPQIRGRS